jgi:hypothetical protein
MCGRRPDFPHETSQTSDSTLFFFLSTTKLRTKKERRKISVAQWEFLGVFMGVLVKKLDSWEFWPFSWEFLGVLWE